MEQLFGPPHEAAEARRRQKGAHDRSSATRRHATHVQSVDASPRRWTLEVPRPHAARCWIREIPTPT